MTSSKWILGFTGEPRTQDHGEWYDTFIGGCCVYPEDINVAIPPCPLCGAQRMLVLQAFAPHDFHSERVIYLFGCNSIRCAGDQSSWFAMRLCKDTQTLDTDVQVAHNRSEIGGELDVTECDNSEPINWDTDSDSDESTASDLVDELAALSLNVQHAKDNSSSNGVTSNHTSINRQTKQNKGNLHLSSPRNTYSAQSAQGSDVSQSQKTFHLNSFYVEVREEPERIKPIVDDRTISHLLIKYENEERSRGASGISEAWGAETEEEELAALENFEIFQDQISCAPEQILRYCFGSKPIWPKYPPPTMETNQNCECGSPFVFEVQVLGSCLYYLQPDKSVGHQRKEAGMNFAAVAIYTCRTDCTTSEILAHSRSFKMLRQAVVIQPDEW